MTKRIVTTTLFQTNRYGDDRWPPENAIDFLNWLQKLIAEAPVEYRGCVKIEFDDDGDYDRPRPQLTVFWGREETDEEEQHREAEDRMRAKISAADEINRLERSLAAAKARLGR